MLLFGEKDGNPHATPIGSLTLHFEARDGADVRLRIPAASLVAALLDYEGQKLLLDSAWGNGDAAEVVIRRVHWRDLPWRLTTQGWVRGPLRVWSPALEQWRASLNDNVIEGWFPTAEAAQAAAMRHSESAA